MGLVSVGEREVCGIEEAEKLSETLISNLKEKEKETE